MSEVNERKQAMAAELNRLAKQNGGKITPRMVVDAARDDNSPLHDYFEWNDSEAAEKYREMQARTLLRSVPLKVKTTSTKFEVSEYIRDPEAKPEDQGYVQVTALRPQEDLARDALVAEFDRVAANLRRARAYAQYFGLEPLLDDLERQVGLARATIMDAAASTRPS